MISGESCVMRSQGPSWQYEGTGAGGCIADSVMNTCTALGRYSWGGREGGGEGNSSLIVSDPNYKKDSNVSN